MSDILWALLSQVTTLTLSLHYSMALWTRLWNPLENLAKASIHSVNNYWLLRPRPCCFSLMNESGNNIKERRKVRLTYFKSQVEWILVIATMPKAFQTLVLLLFKIIYSRCFSETEAKLSGVILNKFCTSYFGYPPLISISSFEGSFDGSLM